ncbi:MAG: O-acetyl-ADP-ribose deacetylase [Acidobacteria bacterium]|nr:MAG: O-acetyl-ADP-ribose deacetylase [Acidobacteriota bacterium]
MLLAGDRALEFDGPADITKETTDAIVNAANSSLLGGGGVDGAIHRAGGPEILAECRQIVSKIGSLPAGQAVITCAGRMSAKHVIHTVGPIYRDQPESATLASCYRESISLAEQRGLQSLAFPSISTGAYGYPLSEAAPVAVSACIGALKECAAVRLVRFVLFDPATLRAYVNAAREFCAINRAIVVPVEDVSR